MSIVYKFKNKINTALFIIRNNGFRELIFQSRIAIRKRIDRKSKISVKDVLIISIEDPLLKRYRADHMAESIESTGATVDNILHYQLTPEHAKFYNIFIFYRCPWSPAYEDFFAEARKHNKCLIYTVDDLIIDHTYTDKLPTVMNMSQSDRLLYDEGVKKYNKVMRSCDYAIATTNQIAEEFSKYPNFKDIFINRNAASQEMIACANKALESVATDEDRLVIGYFSGTSTHNEDFQMIAPALTQIMDENTNVYIKLAGRIDAPVEFKDYEDRIIFTPYVNWQELPFELRKCDIILAPLVDSIFNRAKSEIKWMEAALVGVPVVASDMGSFKDCIQDGVTGILSKNTTNDWYLSIKKIIADQDLRNVISEKSREFVLSNYRTIGKNATDLRNFIRKVTPEIYCFAASSLADISGGNIVVRKHIDLLNKAGNIVYVAEVFDYKKGDKWESSNCADDENLNVFRVNSRRKRDRISLNMKFDKMVATYWQSVDFVKNYSNIWDGGKKFYLVQGREVDFFEEDSHYRREVSSTYYDGFNILTVSKWCKDWLKSDFGQESRITPNGIDISRFNFSKRGMKGRIKILIEGDSLAPNKKIDESFEIANMLDRRKFEISYLTYNGKTKDWYIFDNLFSAINPEEVGRIYSSHDILLKSSVAESFSLPPLEMMATGGVVVLARNEGNSTYVKDGENCLVYSSGDIESAIQIIQEISSNKEKFKEISKNGRKTAEDFDWNNIEQEVTEKYQ